MTQIQKTPRNSSIELLRILAMGMIVLSHICCHSGYDSTYSVLSVNRLFVQFGYLGNLGVALFVMISGYFMSSFRVRSLSRLLSQVWFYSVGLFLICRFCFGYDYTGQMLWQVFLPTIYCEYWFFTAYVVFYLLTPFVNTLIRALSRQQLRTLLMIMTLLWVLIPTVTKQQLYGAELCQFLMYYLLGAYLRLYPDNHLQRKSLAWGAALGAMAVLYGLTTVLGYLERYTPEVFGVSQRFYDRNSLLILLAALGMFSLAVNSRPFCNSFINNIGGCTFGVYLIHDNPAVRELLWKSWLNWQHYFTSGSFILRIVLSVVLVFAVCTALEYLRQKTVAKPMEELFEKVLAPLVGKVRIES